LSQEPASIFAPTVWSRSSRGGEDGHAAGLAFGNAVAAIDFCVGELADGADRLHGRHPLDHRYRFWRHGRGLSKHRGSRAGAQQVGAEFGEEIVELGPAGGGNADHGDHGGDADGDAERRQDDPKRSRAKPIGREPRDVDP
jgi:hypothetical protein